MKIVLSGFLVIVLLAVAACAAPAANPPPTPPTPTPPLGRHRSPGGALLVMLTSRHFLLFALHRSSDWLGWCTGRQIRAFARV